MNRNGFWNFGCALSVIGKPLNNLPEIDYQAISYYADPTAKAKDEGKKEIDPELMKTFDKLGIPLEERMALAGVAVDAVMDSVSVKTTFKEKLQEKGVIFCSISEAVRENPELVRKYLGSVVPYRDNYFAALNSAVFSDGSFVYIPHGVRCPMELSTYFRINARNTGQFERTLIVCEDDAYVSYLEGCTAPMRDENQLHAAIVEIVVGANAEVKYSTVQNWYAGDEQGRGGIYNLVTKRGLCRGDYSKLSWTQVETGSAITWKSSNPAIIADAGTVTLPTSNDVTVILTATITKNGVSDTKEFTLTVRTAASADKAALEAIIAKLGTRFRVAYKTGEVNVLDTVRDKLADAITASGASLTADQITVTCGQGQDEPRCGHADRRQRQGHLLLRGSVPEQHRHRRRAGQRRNVHPQHRQQSQRHD